MMTCIGHLGVGHVGGCLSVTELLAVLYFEAMNIDPKRPDMPGRDRFICSKGHAGPAVYAALANRGYFDKKELLTLNQGGTNLPSHCDMNRTPGVDVTAGSLGQGFSCA
ncbi:MAG: transketolase, partial [Clostridia bacterium]|nr:transketolase [Clostridia bacterium]